MFKVFVVESVQEMIKDEMSTIVNNPKLRISSSKINPDVMKRFFILTINNKYARNVLILQFLLKVSAGSISISNHSSC